MIRNRRRKHKANVVHDDEDPPNGEWNTHEGFDESGAGGSDDNVTVLQTVDSGPKPLPLPEEWDLASFGGTQNGASAQPPTIGGPVMPLSGGQNHTATMQPNEPMNEWNAPSNPFSNPVIPSFGETYDHPRENPPSSPPPK